MRITNIIVEKIEKNHPRYPSSQDQIPVPFTEVYRCEATNSEGKQFESVFFVTSAVGEMSPIKAGDMMTLFARSIARLGEVAEAA